MVHQHYSHLLETLDHIAENGKPDERAEAEGILKQLKLPANVMLLVMFSDVFCQLAPLSDVLQAERCDLASALQLASSHTKVLCQKREQSFYDKMWPIVVKLAENNGIEMTAPTRRPRKAPSTLRNFLVDSTLGHNEVDVSDQPLGPQQYFRVTVFVPVMDQLVAEMDRRFGADEERTPLLKGIAACHPKSTDFLSMPVLQPLVDAYQLNKTGSLSSQIQVCNLLIASQKSKPKSITDVILMLTPPAGFPDLRQVLQLALTVPVANVAAERSFSCMRRIRTYVRSSMTEDRLSALSNINIETDLAKNIDLDELVDIFSKMPNLRDCTDVLGVRQCPQIATVTHSNCFYCHLLTSEFQSVHVPVQ